MQLTFNILTPVKDAGPCLELCVRSTSDQEVDVLHHIQCGGGPITSAVRGFSHVRVAEAHDSGMYAALNSGLASATGGIIGHLNADEQYLPGTLKRVRELFVQLPDTDIVCGDMIITDSEWKPKGYRRSVLPPRGSLGKIPLTIPTCSLFFRRRVFDSNLRYDDRYKAISDAILVHELLPPRHLWYFDPIPYGVFSIHGANLSSSGASELDLKRLNIKPDIRNLFYRVSSWFRKALAGAYSFRHVEVKVFAYDSSENRVSRKASVGWRWYNPKVSNYTAVLQ